MTKPIGSITAEHIWKRFREDEGPAQNPLRLRVPRRRNHNRGWRYVLRDINFNVEPGGSLALIGLNGSGKSTLLKCLSGAMFPYAGRLEIVGRIGALIEVRSGINPDLSGRENVYFNGSMLGLTRKDIAKKFDTIVEFAELEEAIDREVKYYSSGMQMRLGFSIAAFLEPEILFVDEALAVGDLTFQQRCLDRMSEVLSQGTTLVFVSHDLMAVQAMCDEALWLDNAQVRARGKTGEVVAAYRQGLEAKAALIASRLRDPVTLVKATPRGPDGGPARTGEPVDIDITMSSETDRDVRLAVGVTEGPAGPIFMLLQSLHLDAGETTVRCTVRSLPLPKGRFYLWMAAHDAEGRSQMTWHPVAPMDVEGAERLRLPTGVQLMAPLAVPADWSGDAVAGYRQIHPFAAGPRRSNA
jgi:ABC-type polysaccharide/polyol phosphate transport system ATPase subunit